MLFPAVVFAQATREAQYQHTDEVFAKPERGYFRQISHLPGDAGLTVKDVRQARADGFLGSANDIGTYCDTQKEKSYQISE